MTDRAPETDAAMAQAIDWVVRLTSGEATQDDARALAHWRAADPANDAAYRMLATLRPAGTALRREQQVTRRALMAGGGASLAAVLAVGIARPPLGLWPSFAELVADHRTGTAGRLAFRAAPGVRVELDASSSASVDSGGDAMAVVGGQAFVAIARPSPFTLRVRDVAISASHAQVNVDTVAGGVEVACLAGAATCLANDRTFALGPARALRLVPGKVTGTRLVDPASVASCRQGILRFDAAPLAEVLERFNRYLPMPIVLASSAIGERPVSGFFHVRDIDAAVAQLQELLGLPVRQLPGGVILMG